MKTSQRPWKDREPLKETFLAVLSKTFTQPYIHVCTSTFEVIYETMLFFDPLNIHKRYASHPAHINSIEMVKQVPRGFGNTIGHGVSP